MRTGIDGWMEDGKKKRKTDCRKMCGNINYKEHADEEKEEEEGEGEIHGTDNVK
jgi:hypothetical protein